MFFRLVLARCAVAAVLLAPGAAQAQDPAIIAQIYDRPPADFGDEPGTPPPAQKDSGLSLRVDRLERELRQMTGKVEQLEHQVEILEEQLRARPADRLAAPAAPAAAAPAAATPAGSTAPGPGNPRRGDAFDPMSAPGAAGAPQPLGTTAPSAPLAKPPHAAEPGAPLDLTQGRLAQEPASPTPGPAAALGGAPAIPDAPPAQPPAKSDYDQAVANLRAGQYENAEKGFAAFLIRNPKSRLAPSATFSLGESFFLRGRYREAAERYLEVHNKYGQSAQAPDAMLRLGQSLNAIGAKEQACASFSEIGVKYPNAAPRVKEGAERELKKLQC